MRYLEFILSFPKSLYFCFRTLSFKDALHMPIWLRYNVKICNINSIILSGGAKFGLIKIGFGNVGIFDKSRQRTLWDSTGVVVFKGTASIGHGSRIVIGRRGVMTFGDNFICTSSMSVICYKEINIGDNVLVSWDTLIMDTDFHKVLRDNGKSSPVDKAIKIGNHVWIGCRTTILKGVCVGTDSVVAAGSILTKEFSENGILIGGNPAIIIRKDISWSDR